MFPARFFTPTYWPATFWPEVGSDSAAVPTSRTYKSYWTVGYWGVPATSLTSGTGTVESWRLPPMAYGQRDQDVYDAMVAALRAGPDFDVVRFGSLVDEEGSPAGARLVANVVPGRPRVKPDANARNKVRTVYYRVVATAYGMRGADAYRLVDRLDSVLHAALSDYDVPLTNFLLPWASYLSDGTVLLDTPSLVRLAWDGSFTYVVSGLAGFYAGVEGPAG